MGRCNSMYLAVMIGLVVLLLGVAEAQTIPSCASKLTNCVQYLSNTTTTPPSSCCDPLKETVSTDLACLCNLYNTPGLLSGFGINVTQALQLSRRCGITSTLSDCSKASAPPPASVTPPATSGGDGSRVACTGLSFLLLFWASMLFN